MLNVNNSREVIRECTRQKSAYVWGIVLIATVSLFVAFLLTRQYQNEEQPRKHFFVPAWLIGLPPVFGLFYTWNAEAREMTSWSTEELEYSLSGMPKKEYLQFKANDDRAAKSFLGTATSAGVISATNILGPFLRGDR